MDEKLLVGLQAGASRVGSLLARMCWQKRYIVRARRATSDHTRAREEMSIRVARRWGLVSAVIACLIGWSQARADGRVALVIGNSHYQNVPVLANPANDATDVSASLRRLGFNVKTLTDTDFESFRGALIEFGHAAQGADMAVLFFAGHGIEIAGDNWLVPIDAALKNDIDVGTEAIGLHAAMLAVSNA